MPTKEKIDRGFEFRFTEEEAADAFKDALEKEGEQVPREEVEHEIYVEPGLVKFRVRGKPGR